MNLKKRYYTLFFITGLFISPVTLAANYNSEASYYTFDAESPGHNDILHGGARYTQHLATVSAKLTPLAEAAYLGRSRYIKGWFFGEDIDYNNGNNEIAAGGGVEYVHRSMASSIILEILYAKSLHDRDNSSGSSIAEWDESNLNLTVGGFINRATSVKVRMAQTDYDFHTGGADYSTTDVFIIGKKVINRKSFNPVNIEGAIGFVEYGSNKNDNTVFEGAGDFYFSHRHSLGLKYKFETGDANTYEGTTTTIRGRFFLTGRLALAIQKETFSAKNTQGNDYDKTYLELSYRF